MDGVQPCLKQKKTGQGSQEFCPWVPPHDNLPGRGLREDPVVNSREVGAEVIVFLASNMTEIPLF